MKKNLCFESITSYDIAGFTVRIWRTEERIGAETRTDLYGVWLNLLANPESYSSKEKVLEAFANQPNVAAVEVTHRGSKNGCLVYVDWP